MTGFTGRIERESILQNDFNQARLKRLQQVRQQEKALSTDRCDAYRNLIVRRKEVKTKDVKRELIRGRKSLHDEFVNARQQSLIDTGCAHRIASDLSASNAIDKIDAELLRVQKEDETTQREKVAMSANYLGQTAKRELAAALVKRNNLRRCAIASDREDARATAEAKAAKTARLLDDQRQISSDSMLLRRQNDRMNLARQGGLRIQDRRAISLNTSVVRHGAADSDQRAVINSAAMQERYTMTRRWSYVMKELIHRKSSASRAHEAHMNQKSLQKLGQLEAELAALSLADKAASRANLARDTKAVLLGHRHYESSQSSAAAFHREFLAPSGAAPLVGSKLIHHEEAVTKSKPHIEDSTSSSSSGRSRPTVHREPLQWSAGQLSERLDERPYRTSKNTFDVGFGDQSQRESLNIFAERSSDRIMSQDAKYQSKLDIAEDVISVLDMSTSTAPTISARHDLQMRAKMLTQPSHSPGSQSFEFGETEQETDGSLSIALRDDIYTVPDPDAEDIVDSTSLSGLASISRSSVAYGRRPNDSISLSYRQSAEEGSSDFSGPLGLTVKVTTVPSSSSFPMNFTGLNENRNESFEDFFGEVEEDRDSDRGDDDSFMLAMRAAPYTVLTDGTMHSSPGNVSESTQSSKSSSTVEGNTEADDNMSAITWPDLASRRSGGLTTSPSRIGRSRSKKSVTVGSISRSQASIELDNISQRLKAEYPLDDYSLQDDGFLHELDALSKFWTEKKTNSMIRTSKNRLLS